MVRTLQSRINLSNWWPVTNCLPTLSQWGQMGRQPPNLPDLITLTLVHSFTARVGWEENKHKLGRSDLTWSPGMGNLDGRNGEWFPQRQ